MYDITASSAEASRLVCFFDMLVTVLRTDSGVLVAVSAVQSACCVTGFYAQQLGDKSFCVEAAPDFETFQRWQGLQDMHVLSIGRNLTHSRSRGPRARFAAYGRSQCSEALPIWLVAVSGVVFAVRRAFAVHTKRCEVLRSVARLSTAIKRVVTVLQNKLLNVDDHPMIQCRSIDPVQD